MKITLKSQGKSLTLTHEQVHVISDLFLASCLPRYRITHREDIVVDLDARNICIKGAGSLRHAFDKLR
jgi:hypothetical protein